MREPPRRRLFALLAPLFLLAAAGCQGAQGDAPAPADPAEARTPVRVTAALAGEIPETVTARTVLEAESRALISAAASQVVEEIRVEEGDPVHAGDLLARLDDREAQIARRRTELDVDHQAREYERQRAMRERQLVSEEQLLEAGRALEAARIDLDEAALRVARHEIRSPIDGVVSRRHIRRGEMVAVGGPAFEIVDPERLLLTIHVPEREMRRLAAGQRVAVASDTFPARTFPGEIARVSPTVDPDSGTVAIVVRLLPRTEDEPASLRPGMFVEVSVTTEVHRDLVLVPKESIEYGGTGPAVFVVGPDGETVERRPVTLGPATDRLRAVGGVLEGERVVREGLHGLIDGARVEVVAEAE